MTLAKDEMRELGFREDKATDPIIKHPMLIRLALHLLKLLSKDKK